MNIDLIKARAKDVVTRIDSGEKFGPKPPPLPPATTEQVDSTERRLGFRLWPDHLRVLTEIANGGFGPGYGLFGIEGGLSSDLGNAIDIREKFFGTGRFGQTTLLPVNDWGAAVWSCVDCVSGEVVTYSEFGLHRTGVRFGDWLTRWAEGHNWWKEMFRTEVFEYRCSKTGRIIPTTRYLGYPENDGHIVACNDAILREVSVA